jgi:hypothetical protein
VKIFTYHLKLFRFFFNRFIRKTKRVSRRERFKRANKKAGTLERLVINKKDFFYNKFANISSKSKKKKVLNLNFNFFKLYKRKKSRRMFLFLNIFMLPYTKKAVGSRMGKGKGVVKN